MDTRRKVAILLVALCMAVFLAGCEDNEGSSPASVRSITVDTLVDGGHNINVQNTAVDNKTKQELVNELKSVVADAKSTTTQEAVLINEKKITASVEGKLSESHKMLETMRKQSLEKTSDADNSGVNIELLSGIYSATPEADNGKFYAAVTSGTGSSANEGVLYIEICGSAKVGFPVAEQELAEIVVKTHVPSLLLNYFEYDKKTTMVSITDPEYVLVDGQNLGDVTVAQSCSAEIIAITNSSVDKLELFNDKPVVLHNSTAKQLITHGFADVYLLGNTKVGKAEQLNNLGSLSIGADASVNVLNVVPNSKVNIVIEFKVTDLKEYTKIFAKTAPEKIDAAGSFIKGVSYLSDDLDEGLEYSNPVLYALKMNAKRLAAAQSSSSSDTATVIIDNTDFADIADIADDHRDVPPADGGDLLIIGGGGKADELI